MTQPIPRSLTEIEIRALDRGVINLADAHARQSLNPHIGPLLAEALATLTDNGPSSELDATHSFCERLAGCTGQEYRIGSAFPLYSASIGIDIAGKYILAQRYRVGLVTPTFDNIPDLLRRSGLVPVPVPESVVFPTCDWQRLDAMGLGALVLVIPNNPTGATLTPSELRAIVDWAARAGVLLVFDLSFRLFDPGLCWDVIEYADQVGADLVTIDDTGKILPMFGTKVSVLSVSGGLVADLGAICTDVLLAVSELDLRLLELLLDPGDNGEVSRARRLVRTNQVLLDAQLAGHVVQHHADGTHFQPSVAWLSVGPRRDAVVQHCRGRGLELLPGDRFHWDVPRGGPGSDRVRLAMLRDADYFAAAVDILVKAVEHVGHSGGTEEAGND